jgi:phosphate transport system substrate-binding protein
MKRYLALLNSLAGCAVLLIFSECSMMGPQPLSESPTRGNITISVDESFQLLYDTELYTFQSLYPDAKIKANYRPESDVLTDLMNDSVRTIVLTRDLTKQEKEILFAQKFVARTTKIAHDGLALIVNRNNTDTLLLVEQLEDIFRGKLSTWNQISPKSPTIPVNVVFDNNKSGNVRYIREKFALTGNFPPNCFAVNSNEEVIKYVENNRNALGIISVNWVSDMNDSLSNRFLKNISVVGVGTSNLTSNSYSKPYQGYIAEGSYPLIRDVYMICREPFAGLGTGFVSFVAGDQGQRIILKSGLVPATMPIRLIQVKKD